MASQYAALSKQARSLVTRRPVDASELNVTVSSGSIHITGVLRPIKGGETVDLKVEMEQIAMILRQRMNVAEVIWDVSIRN